MFISKIQFKAKINQRISSCQSCSMTLDDFSLMLPTENNRSEKNSQCPLSLQSGHSITKTSLFYRTHSNVACLPPSSAISPDDISLRVYLHLSALLLAWHGNCCCTSLPGYENCECKQQNKVFLVNRRQLQDGYQRLVNNQALITIKRREKNAQ